MYCEFLSELAFAEKQADQLGLMYKRTHVNAGCY